MARKGRSTCWAPCLLLAVCLALLPACAWDPGQPWGRLTGTLTAAWQVPSDRLTPDGRFRTASEYLWRVDAAAITWQGVQAVVAPAGTALTFDPAKPPAGYSNCHGGHCHADDGRLVDYADISLELLGSGSGATTVSLPMAATQTLIPKLDADLPLPPTDLPLGQIGSLQVRAAAVQVRAHVWDAQPGSPRLPAAGVDVTIALPPVQAATQVTASTGLHEPFEVTAAVKWTLPVTWLDGADVAAWPALTDANRSPPATVISELAEALITSGQLSVVVTRN